MAVSTGKGTEPVLSANNISKTYQMGEVAVHALSAVNFALHAGELVVP
jgi:ABC-type lipoprotein export system ATPase subunit